MKRRELIFNSIEAFLYAAALTIGNLFCIVTAFDIPVDAGSLAWLCIFTALVCAFVFAMDRIFFPKIIGFFIIAAVVLLYNRYGLRDGFWISAQRIGDVYSEAYRWNISFDSVLFSEFGDATRFFAAIGILLCALTAWTICGKHQLWVLGAISAVFLVPCLMVKDSAPSVWAVVLLTLTYAMLLITQSRRRVGAEGRYGLSSGALIPVLIVALCIVSSLGPSDYERSDRMERLRDNFKAEIQKHFVIRQSQSTGGIDFISPFTDSTLGSFTWNANTTDVDLSSVGPQSRSGQHVMDVMYDRGGQLYLRANSFGVYEDNGWHALDDGEYKGVSIPFNAWMTNLRTESEIKITTARRSSVMYLPYVPTQLPEGGMTHFDAYVENTEGAIEYTVPTSISAQYIDSWSQATGYDTFVLDRYTRVPDETRAALNDIVEELEYRASEYGQSAVEVVREYVQSSATYDLNTPRMPEGEDFVSWFLNDSDTGYCVHFATAATVLLRCMDIPARYVNGYVITAEAGDWTSVTQNEAHAWVEYYTEGYGWHMLEVTPASEDSDIETEQQIDVEQAERQEHETNTDNYRQQREDNDTSETEIQTEHKKNIPLRIILLILAVVAVFCLWNVAVRRIRVRLLSRGTSNDRTVACYHHVAFLSRLSHEEIPEEIDDLALKARFSQHAMTDDELAIMNDKAAELTNKLLADKNRLRRLIYRFVFAL